MESDLNPVPGTSGTKKGHNMDKPSGNLDETYPIAESSTKPKKTIYQSVHEAFENLGNSRKGASVKAIKKYVFDTREGHPRNLNVLINKALLKGIEEGIFIRPHGQENSKGLMGFLRLVKDKPKKSKQLTEKKRVEKPASDSEATTKTTKPRKRNLSDTAIEDFQEQKIKPSKPKTGNVKIKKIVNTADPKAKIKKMEHAEDPKGKIKKTEHAEEPKGKVKKTEHAEEPKGKVKKTEHAEEPKGKVKKINSEDPKAKKKTANTEVPKSKIKRTNAEASEVKTTQKQKAITERTESSDSEVVVKKKGRKSIKSYSSDTEIDFVERSGSTSTPIPRQKRAKELPKAEKSKQLKTKATRKLYNSETTLENERKQEVKAKTTRAKAKNKVQS